MPAKNFFDAVLVGLDLSTLLAGALLAKRGFRVLLLGHGAPWPSYRVGALTLPRAPFSLTTPDSPALTRVFSELAMKPLFSRRVRPLSPSFQAVLPRHRLDFQPHGANLLREVEREFPAARRVMEELGEAARASDARLDALVARDLMWPPESFFERREFRAALELARLDQSHARLLAHEPLLPGRPLARVLDAVLRFADGSSLAEGLSARGLRAWQARLSAAELTEGGLSGLYELLLASIRTHNGSVRLADRAQAISTRDGALESVHLLPTHEQIGCHFLLWGAPVEKLAQLLPDRRELAPCWAETGEPRARYSRYTLNLLLPRSALPEGMERTVLLLGEEPLWLERRAADEQHDLLTIESRIARGDGDHDLTSQLALRRERILRELTLLSPFLSEQLLLRDSPHDGRPPEGPWAGELSAEDAFRRGPDTMEGVYAFPRPRLHGSAGLTVRTPLKRILLCNTQVVSGLGLEGAFLTAWSAARAVTRSLARGFMNRGRWTKVEL